MRLPTPTLSSARPTTCLPLTARRPARPGRPAAVRLPCPSPLLAALCLALPLLTGAAPAPAATAAVDNEAQPSRPQPISDEVIAQEYDAYRASVKGQKMYTVSYILLADEQDARQWIGKLRLGAPFDQTARTHSKHAASAAEGGRLGPFATCRWSKDTIALLDALKPGQIHGKPVKASAGWGIYRLDAVRPLEPISYAQYKDQLLSGTFQPECPWVPPVSVSMPR